MQRVRGQGLVQPRVPVPVLAREQAPGQQLERVLARLVLPARDQEALPEQARGQGRAPVPVLALEREQERVPPRARALVGVRAWVLHRSRFHRGQRIPRLPVS